MKGTADAGVLTLIQPQTPSVSGLPAGGRRNYSQNVWQEQVFSGNQCASGGTGGMGGYVQKAPQMYPASHAASGCDDTALHERLPATADAVKPLPARPARRVG